jgi:hypothetical protein
MVKLGNLDLRGLFDTGSSATLGRTLIAKELGIHLNQGDQTITSASGHTLSVTSKGQTTLQIGGHRREITMGFIDLDYLGSQTPFDIIIGGDSLIKFPSFHIDYQKGTLTMGENVLRTLTEAEALNTPKKIRVRRDVEVPAQTKVRVEVLVDANDKELLPCMSLHEVGKRLPKKLEILDPIIEIDHDKEPTERNILITVYNRNEKPLKLYRKQVIGEARNLREWNNELFDHQEITEDMIAAVERNPERWTNGARASKQPANSQNRREVCGVLMSLGNRSIKSYGRLDILKTKMQMLNNGHLPMDLLARL